MVTVPLKRLFLALVLKEYIWQSSNLYLDLKYVSGQVRLLWNV